MELPNIKELEKLLKMCRKQGITDLKMGEMSFKFGDLPDNHEAQEEEQVNNPSDEEMLYYSAMPQSGEQ